MRREDDRPEERSAGFFAELLAFLRDNKVWWLTPIALLVLLVVLLVLFGSSDNPFDYSLF